MQPLKLDYIFVRTNVAMYVAVKSVQSCSISYERNICLYKEKIKMFDKQLNSTN